MNQVKASGILQQSPQSEFPHISAFGWKNKNQPYRPKTIHELAIAIQNNLFFPHIYFAHFQKDVSDWEFEQFSCR